MGDIPYNINIMKYIKGSQDYKIWQVNAKRRFDWEWETHSETVWIYRHKNWDEILLNNCLMFAPHNSWWAIIPKEVATLTDVLNLEELTFHPEAWEMYLEEGIINEAGEVIVPEESEFKNNLI